MEKGVEAIPRCGASCNPIKANVDIRYTRILIKALCRHVTRAPHWIALRFGGCGCESQTQCHTGGWRHSALRITNQEYSNEIENRTSRSVWRGNATDQHIYECWNLQASHEMCGNAPYRIGRHDGHQQHRLDESKLENYRITRHLAHDDVQEADEMTKRRM